MHREGNAAGLQRGPRGRVGRMLLPGSFQPPACSAQAAPAAPVLAGEAGSGSPVSLSHPAIPERDELAAHTLPCFFHRFCVSISMELMNNSNMNIIHCIWAGVISGREEIKSSKRLAGSPPARASRGAVGGRRAAPGSHHPTPVLPQARSPVLWWHEPASPGEAGSVRPGERSWWRGSAGCSGELCLYSRCQPPPPTPPPFKIIII